MTNEEMEKAIEFVLGQQAQAAAGLQMLTADVQALATSHAGLTASYVKLAEATLANTGAIGRLAEAQARTDEKVARLAESQAELAERLDAFIVTVERYIAEGRNGNAKK